MTHLAAAAPLASSFTVSGAHGFLILIAFIAFIIAAFLAWFIAPRQIWGTLVAAGLALYMLALLFGG
jgi:hypothetical protein